MMFQWNSEMIRFMKDASEYTDYNKKLAKILAKHLPTNATVFEVGCGLGFLTLALSSHVKSITAMDLNADAIAVLSENCERQSITSINVLRGDVFAPEPSESVGFDALVSCMCLDAQSAVSLAKKHGIHEILLVVSKEDHHRFSAGKEKKKNRYQEQIDWLNREGICYKSHDVSMEFGQPLRSMEDARAFLALYNRKKDQPLTESDVREMVRENDDKAFPWYIPMRRNRALLVIEL